MKWPLALEEPARTSVQGRFRELFTLRGGDAVAQSLRYYGGPRPCFYRRAIGGPLCRRQMIPAKGPPRSVREQLGSDIIRNQPGRALWLLRRRARRVGPRRIWPLSSSRRSLVRQSLFHIFFVVPLWCVIYTTKNAILRRVVVPLSCSRSMAGSSIEIRKDSSISPARYSARVVDSHDLVVRALLITDQEGTEVAV